MNRPRAWMLAAALVGVAIALLAVLGGFPDIEGALRGAGSTLGPYTYALVGALAFLETGAGIGLIAPGELAVILGGVAAGQGEIELAPLIALVWVCAAAGDVLSFVLGRRLGRGFIHAHGHHVKLTPARLEQVERYFARHGGKTIVFGRFIGAVRALAPFVAGASGMPARRFLPATIGAAGANRRSRVRCSGMCSGTRSMKRSRSRGTARSRSERSSCSPSPRRTPSGG